MKRALPSRHSERYPRYHAMRPAAQFAEHPGGIGIINRLSKHLVVQNNDRIGRNNQFIVNGLVGQSLFTGNILRNLLHRKIMGIAFLNAGNDAHLKGDIQTGKKLSPSGRGRCQDYLIILKHTFL